MDKYNKEISELIFSDQDSLLKEIQSNYAAALANVKKATKQLLNDEAAQSRVYQPDFQSNINKRIDNIVSVLRDNNEATMESYLKSVYRNAFNGTNYVLQKQEIPVLISLSEEEILVSVMRKTEDANFLQRIASDIAQLKQDLIDVVSRSLAAQQDYKTIAQQLSLMTQESFNREKRIAITESGRIESEAKLNCQQKAKARGVKIVKIWDATLDNKTRTTHKELHGQERDIDDYFEVEGLKTIGPNKFGIAAEDCNCRCILLTRAKFFDSTQPTDTLISAKDFKEWNKKREVI